VSTVPITVCISDCYVTVLKFTPHQI